MNVMTQDSWTERWNDRYRSKEFAYGEEPNNYLREQLDGLTPGSILFPAEGEGRNAVYAARTGWNVSAFDISTEGKKKADGLASANGVFVDYRIGPLESLGYTPEQFDAIALIYAHFPAAIKSSLHRSLNGYLKKGGYIIFEAFSKHHIEYVTKNEKVGGPKEVEMLFSKEELEADFPGYEILELRELEIELSEGEFHNGIGSVIRFLGKKKEASCY
jgi:SAM-dependent methyltransferase